MRVRGHASERVLLVQSVEGLLLHALNLIDRSIRRAAAGVGVARRVGIAGRVFDAHELSELFGRLLVLTFHYGFTNDLGSCILVIFGL